MNHELIVEASCICVADRKEYKLFARMEFSCTATSPHALHHRGMAGLWLPKLAQLLAGSSDIC